MSDDPLADLERRVAVLEAAERKRAESDACLAAGIKAMMDGWVAKAIESPGDEERAQWERARLAQLIAENDYAEGFITKAEYETAMATFKTAKERFQRYLSGQSSLVDSAGTPPDGVPA